jgi:hypothetical protein
MSLNGPTTPAGTGRSPREIDADVASSANATPAQRRGGVCPLADFHGAQAAVPAAREHSYVIHEGAGGVKGRCGNFVICGGVDFAVNSESCVVVGVPGLCPGFLVLLPGELGRVKRPCLRAWASGAGWGALDAGG